MPRVSVLIPSFNHEKYITEAIQSVLDQTFADFEIVIVDDLSTDGTVARIEAFDDPRIQLHCSEKNEGQFVTVRKCLEQARGEYIAILNSDDAFAPDKLEKQVAFLDGHPEVGAVFSHARLIRDDGGDFEDADHFYYGVFEQENRSRQAWLRYFFEVGNCLCHPSVLIRKVCHDQLGHYREYMTQMADFELWVRLCLSWEIHIIPEKLTLFRIRDNEANLSGRKPETISRCGWELYEILKNYLLIDDPEEFFTIFPNIRAQAEGEIEPDLIPFLFARHCLRQSAKVWQVFAMQTLLDQFKERERAAKIEARLGFSPRDLIRLTGEYDLFNLVKNYATSLHPDTGDGFRDDRAVTLQGVNPYDSKRTVTFDLGDFKGIRALRWDPLRGNLSSVRINSVTWLDGSGETRTLDLDRVSSNGFIRVDGVTEFRTYEPRFYLPIQGDVRRITIDAEWSIADSNEFEGLARIVRNSTLLKGMLRLRVRIDRLLHRLLGRR